MPSADGRRVVRTAGAVAAAMSLLAAVPVCTSTGHSAPGRPSGASGSLAAGGGPSLGASYRLTDAVRPASSAGTKEVEYLGYRFLVPRGWPVVDDGRDRNGCVRFDRHAIYLGAPGSEESCPSGLLGTTESILIEPAPANSGLASTEDQVARRVTVRAPGMLLIATFDAHPEVIDQILASAGLPAPVPVPVPTPAPQTPAPDLLWRVPPGFGAVHHRVTAPPLPPTIVDYSGLGFDTCAAPSRSTMRAWLRRSRYRAAGIYIGGSDLTCPQLNLTRAWVRAEAAAGWHLIPLYGGPQANLGQLVAPGRQGRESALDAAAHARRLGFAPHTPLYYDMEGFHPEWNAPALQFMSAWTRELHRLGYRSGIYSSGDSGIQDLIRHFHSRAYAMPDVIYDATWNGVHSASVSRLGHLWWHRRIHQFLGRLIETHGGVTMRFSGDFLGMRPDVGYNSAFTSQQTPAVNLPDGGTAVFYLGRGRELWRDWYEPGKGWAKPVAVGSRAWSAPSAVWTGSAVAVFYKGASGRLQVLTYSENGHRAGLGVLTMMGRIGLGPSAVSEPGGVIDVFWRGSDDRLWHGQFTPGAGWAGPQRLASALRSAPSPVASSPGSTAVFWQGTHDSLWTIGRGLSGTWSRPRRLRLAAGGAPQATAQLTGGTEVYWTGSGTAGLREAFDRPGARWQGPRSLGGQLSSAPLPATAAGAVRVLWLGQGHHIDYTEHRSSGNWNALGWTRPAAARQTWADSAPFAAIGGQRRSLRVFWRGQGGSLWTATLTRATWSRPVRL